MNLVALAAVATSALLVPSALAPVKVRATKLDERSPVAGNGWVAWAQNSRARPNHYDAFVRRGRGKPAKVNPRGTQAFPGGITGGRLVYQEVTAAGDSDIRFYDLRARRRSSPAGVNSAEWERNPRMSGNWLLFDRGPRPGASFVGGRASVRLRNLSTREEIVVDEDEAGRVVAGDIRGRYVTWKHERSIGLYDVAHRRTLDFRWLASFESSFGRPSVTADGTIYAAFWPEIACENSLVMVPRDGDLEPLLDLRRGFAVRSTYAVTTRGRTSVYYDVAPCGRDAGDIYRLGIN